MTSEGIVTQTCSLSPWQAATFNNAIFFPVECLSDSDRDQLLNCTPTELLARDEVDDRALDSVWAPGAKKTGGGCTDALTAPIRACLQGRNTSRKVVAPIILSAAGSPRNHAAHSSTAESMEVITPGTAVCPKPLPCGWASDNDSAGEPKSTSPRRRDAGMWSFITTDQRDGAARHAANGWSLGGPKRPPPLRAVVVSPSGGVRRKRVCEMERTELMRLREANRVVSRRQRAKFKSEAAAARERLSDLQREQECLRTEAAALAFQVQVLINEVITQRLRGLPGMLPLPL
jgi:hypothetical protein